MGSYDEYTLEIRLKSSIITPFQSDTLFGHICWAIRYSFDNGLQKLEEFLQQYERANGNNPPLLISNGFPKGFLPKPLLEPIGPEVLNNMEEIKKDRRRSAYQIKQIKSFSIISKERFSQLQKKNITPKTLFKAMLDDFSDLEKEWKKGETHTVQHNTINRASNTVLGGGLFSRHERFYELADEKRGIFEIYLKTNHFSKAEIEKIFNYIRLQGYGKDKTTGKGQFSFQVNEGFDLPVHEAPNAFMTLSSFIPIKNDPTNGHYQILHKYGKLGGKIAEGGDGAGSNPFKKPLIMFSAGSTFFDAQYNSNKSYGALMADVHHNPSIRHYACAFPLGIHIGKDDENV